MIFKECICEQVTKILGGDGEDYARQHLKLLVVDDVNWESLYTCPQTNRYWKEYKPHSEAHGGGPSDFIQITEEQAHKEFKF